MGLLPGREAITLPGRLRVPPAERARERRTPRRSAPGRGHRTEAVHQLGHLRGPPALAGPSVTTRTRAATADGLWLAPNNTRIPRPLAPPPESRDHDFARAIYHARKVMITVGMLEARQPVAL